MKYPSTLVFSIALTVQACGAFEPDKQMQVLESAPILKDIGCRGKGSNVEVDTLDLFRAGDIESSRAANLIKDSGKLDQSAAIEFAIWNKRPVVTVDLISNTISLINEENGSTRLIGLSLGDFKRIFSEASITDALGRIKLIGVWKARANGENSSSMLPIVLNAKFAKGRCTMYQLDGAPFNKMFWHSQ